MKIKLKYSLFIFEEFSYTSIYFKWEILLKISPKRQLLSWETLILLLFAETRILILFLMLYSSNTCMLIITAFHTDVWKTFADDKPFFHSLVALCPSNHSKNSFNQEHWQLVFVHKEAQFFFLMLTWTLVNHFYFQSIFKVNESIK